MFTLLITAIGLLMLWACLRLRRFFPGLRHNSICYAFIILWAVLTATSASFGVRAGYSVLLESAVFLVTFSIPALVALRKRETGTAANATNASQNNP